MPGVMRLASVRGHARGFCVHLLPQKQMDDTAGFYFRVIEGQQNVPIVTG